MAAIGINAHLLSKQSGYRQAGIHHYIAQVLQHLPADNGLDYTVFTASTPQQGHTSELSHLRLVDSPWNTEHPLARIAWEQLVWPLAAVRRRLDLLHSMAFVAPILSPCPTVVTVYDLSFIQHPERFTRSRRWYLTHQTRRTCQQARRIITISESSKQDVAHHFNVPLDKIDVAYPGVEARFRPFVAAEVAEFRQREGLPDRYILHVGTLQPRKNIPMLLEAFASLPDKEIALVLVGGKGWLYKEIFSQVEALHLEQRVHFIGYVADEELPMWYSAADLLVLPSVYEGFGLPIVEAMACGTAVVTANVSSMPEAAGDAALLFNPTAEWGAAELAERIATVLDNPAQAATMRERGFVQARKFSWAQAGEATAEAYKKALAAPD